MQILQHLSITINVNYLLMWVDKTINLLLQVIKKDNFHKSTALVIIVNLKIRNTNTYYDRY